MEANKKWYQSSVAIVALIFLLFPVGLFLMWKYTGWNKVVKAVITGVYLLFIVGSSISSGNSVNKIASNNTQAQKTAVEVSVPTSTPIPSPTIELIKKDQAKVTKVVDGDTITVSINGKSETIRIIGINSPETVDPRKSVECFGQKASAMAKEQLSNQTVQLEADISQGERDKYGRLLRYVWLDDGSSDFGALMIQNGYAYEYTYNTPYKYQAKYKQLQKDAEAGNKGLWADNACPINPTTSTTTKTQNTTNTEQTQNTSGSTSTSTYSGGDKDCKDFTTHAEAQAYFNSKGGSASNNVDRLDGSDHDGIVCEALP